MGPKQAPVFLNAAGRAVASVHQGVLAAVRNPTAAAATMFTSLIRDPEIPGAYGYISGGAPDFKWVGWVLCIVLAVLGFKFGAEQYLLYVDEAAFYQPLFGPALSLACTGHLDGVQSTAQINSFLVNQEPLPAGCDGLNLVRIDGWNSVDFSTAYLYMLAAVSWTLFGFDWSSLFFAAGILTAMTAVGAYMVLRCFAGSRAIAFVLALLVLYSSPVRDQIPHLRDFSKAPLIFLALGLIGRTVTRNISLRAAILWALAAGVFVGLGKGFRSDVILVMPVAFLCLLLTPLLGATLKSHFLRASACFLALLGGYLLGGAPIDIINAVKPFAGVGLGHVFILGFGEPFYNLLGMTTVDYSLLRLYRDENVFAMVSQYVYGHGEQMLPAMSAQYETASRQLLADAITVMPDDAFRRVFATANAIGGFALNYLVYGPVLLVILLLGALTTWRSVVVFLIAACVIIPILSLQYSVRHSFFVVFLGAAAMGIAATALFEAVAALIRRARGGAIGPLEAGLARRATWSFAVAVALIATTAALAAMTRALQEQGVARHLAAYEALDWRDVPIVADGRTVLTNLEAPAMRAAAGAAADEQLLYGVARIEIAAELANGAADVGLPLEWLPAQPGALVSQDGRTFTPSPVRGYQFVTPPMSTEGLARGPNGQPFIELSLAGTGGEGWMLGVQDGAGSAWLATWHFPPGAFRSRTRLYIPESTADYRLVIEASVPSVAPLEFDQFAAWSSQDDSGRCAADYFTITERYAQVESSGQLVEGARQAVYYFPFYGLPWWSMMGVELTGLSARCVTRFAVAHLPPAHLLPLTMLITDQTTPGKSERVSWAALGADFWRWGRRPTYP